MLKVRLSYGALAHIRDLLEEIGEQEDLYTKFADAWNRDYLISAPTVVLEDSEVSYVKRLLEGHITSPSTTNAERGTSKRVLVEFESAVPKGTRIE